MTINAWGSPTPMPVDRGGTDQALIPANHVILGDGNAISTTGGTNGEIILGDAVNPPAFVTPTGTTNQLTTVLGPNTLGLSIASNAVLPGTESTTVPLGTTVQRGTGVSGKLRYNTTLDMLEGRNNAAWLGFGGGPPDPFVALAGAFWGRITPNTALIPQTAFSSSYHRYYSEVVFGPFPTPGTASVRIRATNGGVPITTGYIGGTYYFGAGSSTSSDGWYILSESGTWAGGSGQMWLSNAMDSALTPTLMGSLQLTDASGNFYSTWFFGSLATNQLVNGLQIVGIGPADWTLSGRTFAVRE